MLMTVASIKHGILTVASVASIQNLNRELYHG